MQIILIGGVIAGIGAFITVYGTYLHNKKSSEKSDRIEQGVNKGVTIGEVTSHWRASSGCVPNL